MGALKRLVIWALFAMLLATMQDVGGHIVLPEMGLTPPGWWAWFWLSFIIELPALTIWALAQAEVAKVARFW